MKNKSIFYIEINNKFITEEFGFVKVKCVSHLFDGIKISIRIDKIKTIQNRRNREREQYNDCEEDDDLIIWKNNNRDTNNSKSRCRKRKRPSISFPILNDDDDNHGKKTKLKNKGN